MLLPLLTHATADAALIWHRGQPIARGGFAHAARQLRARLPAKNYVINLCNGRMAFMLGLAAAAMRGQITLLPHNQTPTALATLQSQYPDHYVLDDACLQDLDWRSVDADTDLPIDADAIVAILFTSGSTGAPQAQAKSWRALQVTGVLDGRRFLRRDTMNLEAMNLVATVPSQHMFGLQTTALMPFANHCAIHDSRPFYPADIRAALQSVPAPRALIATPVHLRACMAAQLELPSLEFVLSATAPLSVELARQTEAAWNTRVLEIYGSTEAGTIATRRLADSDIWRLIPDARLEATANGNVFYAAHLSGPLPLNDRLEQLSPTEFRLLGRDSEHIKIAGKRASLGELTQALLSIPGVTDGAVFLPPGRDRTAALAVSSQFTAAQLLDRMAAGVDAVFLPRPLILLERLPRNEVGKLTQAALNEALHAYLQH